jgi:hypothetical protein
MPLVNAGGEKGVGGKSQQQELPAWLDSLRTHDRPVPNGTGDHQPFSMAELVDENAMPSWMRMDQSKLNESAEYPAVSPKGKPGSAPTDSTLAGSGFSASSLIDEKSLPSWMRGQENGQSVAEQNLSANSLVDSESVPTWMKNLDSGKSASAQGMPTSSQKQSESVPAWMQNMDAGKSVPAQGMPMSSQKPSESLPPWMQSLDTGKSGSAQGAPMSNQIPSQSVPAWMQNLDRGKAGSAQNMPMSNQKQSEPPPPWMQSLAPEGPSQAPSWQANAQYGLPTAAQVPLSPPVGAQGVPQTPPTTPATYNAHEVPQIPTQGFSARDLVDQQSLPNWLTNNGQQGPGGSAPMGAGLSAGDLIDQQSLPTWLKNQPGKGVSGPVPAMGAPVNGSGQGTGMGQGSLGGAGIPAANLLDTNSLPPWMREEAQGTNSAYTQGTQQPGGSGMIAGSLVDLDALPAWMRNPDNAQNIQASGGLRSGQLQPQARVPSRPRSETGAQEQAEAAANIFASMLGVSASSPNVPGQPQTSQGTPQGQSGSQAQINPGISQEPSVRQTQQPVMPNWQSPQQPAVNQAPSAWQMSASPPPGAPSAPNPFYQQPGGMGEPPTPQRMGERQPGYMGMMGEQQRAGGGSALGVGGPVGTGAQAEGPKKKGFFEAIREFFFK